MGFLVDVFKVLGLVGFSLACTLLAHAVANGVSRLTTSGLVDFADSLRKYLVCPKISRVCEYGWQSLTGCGKTRWARRDFIGLYVRDNRGALPQDSRARLAGRARRGGNPICPRRAFRACLALHAPRSVVLAAFFSILLRALAFQSLSHNQQWRHST